MSRSKELFTFLRDEEMQRDATIAEQEYFNSIYINNQNSNK
jgi:hypothetical protein